jgi:CubicO group peptidase (beta-lactamase class C family)
VRLDRLDDAMRAEIDAGHYAGISVMVARHGNLVKFGSYGYQSLVSRAPLREDAIFRIASMTKPIGSACGLVRNSRTELKAALFQSFSRTPCA